MVVISCLFDGQTPNVEVHHVHTTLDRWIRFIYFIIRICGGETSLVNRIVEYEAYTSRRQPDAKLYDREYWPLINLDENGALNPVETKKLYESIFINYDSIVGILGEGIYVDLFEKLKVCIQTATLHKGHLKITM